MITDDNMAKLDEKTEVVRDLSPCLKLGDWVWFLGKKNSSTAN
jgi:hypothetical protein